MPRRSVSLIDVPCCYHVTQRCQERRFLLRFKKDRQQYLRRLREAAAKYPVSVLDYMITSNHVHLLLWAERAAQVSAAMRYLSGVAAQDYNRRKGREGAFWRGRFRPTLVETGAHLSRCLFYLEMNMVRAGVVSHPSEWDGGAWGELTGKVTRVRLIDRQRLLNCLECGHEDQFRDWYARTLQELCERGSQEREPVWTEGAAVGGRAWIERLAERLPTAWHPVTEVAQATGTFALRVSNRCREGLLQAITG